MAFRFTASKRAPLPLGAITILHLLSISILPSDEIAGKTAYSKKMMESFFAPKYLFFSKNYLVIW
jgi:hypothetical protein